MTLSLSLAKSYTIIIIISILILCIVSYYLSKKSPTHYNTKKAVLYYIEDCQACREFKPIWDRLESENLKGVTFISIDSNKYPEIADRNNVNLYPTIHIQNEEYTGDMSYDSLKKFLLS